MKTNKSEDNTVINLIDAFNDAAKTNDINKLEELLSLGIDIDTKNHRGETTLHIAATSQSYQAIELLVSKGANLKTTNSKNKTPLDLLLSTLCVEATVMGMSDSDFDLALPILDLLIKDDANFTMPSGSNNYIHVAILSKASPLAAYLIKNTNIDINAKNKGGFTPMELAIDNISMDTISALIEKGVNLKILDSKGEELFHTLTGALINQFGYAHFGEKTCNILELLFTKNASDINTKNIAGDTPLHLAILKNRIDVIKSLINHKVDPMIKNAEGDTALHILIRGDLEEFINLL